MQSRSSPPRWLHSWRREITGTALAVLLTLGLGVLVQRGAAGQVYSSSPTGQPGPAAPGPAMGPNPPGSQVVAFPSGWNLVSAPAGTPLPANGGPLYTFQPGDETYEAIPPQSMAQAGVGYWAYFNQPTSFSLAGSSAPTATIILPPGGAAMVGNPDSEREAAVSGADSVYLFTDGEYQATSSIPPGHGAWVFSVAGGPVVVDASGTISSNVGMMVGRLAVTAGPCPLPTCTGPFASHEVVAIGANGAILFHTMSDAAGDYSLSLPAGAYQVTTRTSGQPGGAAQRATVSAGKRIDLNIVLPTQEH